MGRDPSCFRPGSLNVQPSYGASPARRAERKAPVRLLLDTCTLIWLLTGERKLPERVPRGDRGPRRQS